MSNIFSSLISLFMWLVIYVVFKNVSFIRRWQTLIEGESRTELPWQRNTCNTGLHGSYVLVRLRALYEMGPWLIELTKRREYQVIYPIYDPPNHKETSHGCEKKSNIPKEISQNCGKNQPVVKNIPKIVEQNSVVRNTFKNCGKKTSANRTLNRTTFFSLISI